jgi:signal transduction histidine kinase
MSLVPHLPTLHLAASISAATAAVLLLTHRQTLRDIRGSDWILCFVAMSLSLAAFSLRGHVPDWVPIVIGNTMGWLTIAAAWHGCRRIRNAPSRAWLMPMPSLIWLALCLMPAFYFNDRIRIIAAGLIGILMFTALSAEAWITWRKTKLPSMRDLAVLLSIFIPYFTVRSLAASFGLEWLSHMMSGWIALVTATAVPFIMLAVTREGAAELLHQREVAALREGRAQIDRLLQDLPAVLFMREVQPDGTSRLLYRAGDAQRVFGWPAEVLARMDDLSQLAVGLTDAQRQGSYMNATPNELISMEYQIRLPDGGTKWLRASGRILEIRPDGSRLGVGHITDIQDLRNAEARAASAARLASLGEMAAGLAHELRQPLAIVSMAAENTVDDIAAGDSEAAQARLSRIICQSERASEIIENLRRFAVGTHEAGATEPMPLQEVVERALMLMRGVLHQGGVTVELAIASPSPVALAWPGAIEQVLVNLLSNANDALAARPPGTRRVRIEGAADPGAGTVRLVVADTGGGVAPEILPRLFQPFVTTKAADRGTGLGLAICHGMARALGGTISVENQRDGAAFTVILPDAKRPDTGEGNSTT